MDGERYRLCPLTLTCSQSQLFSSNFLIKSALKRITLINAHLFRPQLPCDYRCRFHKCPWARDCSQNFTVTLAASPIDQMFFFFGQSFSLRNCPLIYQKLPEWVYLLNNCVKNKNTAINVPKVSHVIFLVYAPDGIERDVHRIMIWNESITNTNEKSSFLCITLEK